MMVFEVEMNWNVSDYKQMSMTDCKIDLVVWLIEKGNGFDEANVVLWICWRTFLMFLLYHLYHFSMLEKHLRNSGNQLEHFIQSVGLSECFVLWLDEAGLCLFWAPSVKLDRSHILAHTQMCLHTRNWAEPSLRVSLKQSQIFPPISVRKICFWLKKIKWTKEDNLKLWRCNLRI